MAAPPALARQADIERAVRALKACGCEHVRVVITQQGVVVEPAVAPQPLDNPQEPSKPKRVLVC